MKVGEAIQRIQSLYSRGAESDSSRLQDRHIYSVIKTARAFAVDDTFWMSGGWDYQSICVPIQESSAAECGCGPSMGVSFWRSCDRLPLPLRRKGEELVSVSSMDGTMAISKTTWEAARHRAGSRYKMNEYFIKDGYLYYISTGQRIKQFSVNGVWFDPVEAAKFSGENVDAKEVSLGVSPELWARIVELIKDELRLFVQMEEDGTTDSTDRPTK